MLDSCFNEVAIGLTSSPQAVAFRPVPAELAVQSNIHVPLTKEAQEN